MRYQKFQPAQALIPFVECYYIWEGQAVDPLDVQTPPNSFGAMVFNYGDPYKAYQLKGEVMDVPLAFVSGQFTANFHLVLHGAIAVAGIVFKPTGLHNFFGLRMSTLVNSRMALPLLLGEDAQALWQRVKDETADEGRVKILEEFLLARLADAKGRLSVIDEAADLIVQHNGNITVEALAEQLKVSRRYLEKRFQEKVGVSPKFYARIRRFGVLSNEVAHSDTIDWQNVVVANGYHDQSHLGKEYQEFNGTNPATYHREHNELVRFVKKPKVGD